MKKIRSKHTISGVFVFLLLGIFAVAATVLVLIGANAYHASTNASQEHNARRLAASYIRSRLREADAAGRINLQELDGSSIIKIENTDEGTVTLLYIYQGMLYEWYTLRSLAERFEVPDSSASAQIQPADMQHEAMAGNFQPVPDGPQGLEELSTWTPMGESVCEVDEMLLEAEGNLLTVLLRYDDDWTQVTYAVRTNR